MLKPFYENCLNPKEKETSTQKWLGARDVCAPEEVEEWLGSDPSRSSQEPPKP